VGDKVCVDLDNLGSTVINPEKARTKKGRQNYKDQSPGKRIARNSGSVLA